LVAVITDISLKNISIRDRAETLKENLNPEAKGFRYIWPVKAVKIHIINSFSRSFLFPINGIPSPYT
jgi:hypothetical protein